MKFKKKKYGQDCQQEKQEHLSQKQLTRERK